MTESGGTEVASVWTAARAAGNGALTGERGGSRRGAGPGLAYRTLDVILALLFLILAAPLMLCLSILVRVTSRGPVFYKQRRVGLDRRWGEAVSDDSRREIDYGGRLFDIYKFRTMRTGADEGGQVWATQDDPRITPLGRLLRAYRLDELPQLINVLKGDMSIVGPRPEQPEIALVLQEQIDRYSHRHRVLPGITGWAQINQQYDRDIEDVRRKVALDLEYIERQSVGGNLTILVRTVPVVLFKRGAY